MKYEQQISHRTVNIHVHARRNGHNQVVVAHYQKAEGEEELYYLVLELAFFHEEVYAREELLISKRAIKGGE